MRRGLVPARSPSELRGALPWREREWGKSGGMVLPARSRDSEPSGALPLVGGGRQDNRQAEHSFLSQAATSLSAALPRVSQTSIAF